MIITPTPYGIKTRARQKLPLYFVRFGEIGDGVLSPALDEEFSTGAISNPSKVRKTWMLMPQGVSQSISVLGGTSSISSLTISVIDKLGVVTKFVSTYKWKNRICTLYAGYYGLPENQFIPLFRGLIDDVALTPDGTAWSWTITDFQRLSKSATTFNATAQLVQPMTGTPTFSVFLKTFSWNNPFTGGNFGDVLSLFQRTETDVLQGTFDTEANAQGYINNQPNGSNMFIKENPISMVANVSNIVNFAPSTNAGPDRGNVNFIKIDDEIMSYAETVLPTDSSTASITILTRGLFGTEIKNHDFNAKVVNFVKLDGNPLDILLQLYTSITGDGSNGPYDVLPAGQGAAIPQDFVDVAGIEAQRDRLVAGLRFQFYIQEGIEIKSFIETEILRVINAYPTVKNDGRLSVKLYTPPLPTDVTAELTDSNMAGIPSFDLSMKTQSTFFNEVDFKYDYDPLADEFNQETIVLDEASIELSGDEESVLLMESKGLRFGRLFKGEEAVRRYANQLFQRFGKGCPMINSEFFYSQHLVEVGDFVTIKSVYLPDLTTRSRDGNPVICEVIDKQYNFQMGRVRFTLAATGFLSTRRFFVISPAGFPDYENATEEQRKYGFISRKLGENLGVMNNGDPGYYITP